MKEKIKARFFHFRDGTKILISPFQKAGFEKLVGLFIKTHKKAH